MALLAPPSSARALRSDDTRSGSSGFPAQRQHFRRPGQRLVTSAAAAAGGFADDHSSRVWSTPHPLAQQLREFVAAQYLPIALVCALTLGAVNPALGLAASKMHIPALATFGIFMVQVRPSQTKAKALSMCGLGGATA